MWSIVTKCPTMVINNAVPTMSSIKCIIVPWLNVSIIKVWSILFTKIMDIPANPIITMPVNISNSYFPDIMIILCQV